MIKESFNTRRCLVLRCTMIIHRFYTLLVFLCLCIKMFCLHGSVVLYRYRHETDSAMMAQMEEGVASTEQSTQWRRICRMRRDTRLRMRKMNKGLVPINSMATKMSNTNHNNKWLFNKEQVLSRLVVWLTIEIVLITNTLIYIHLYYNVLNYIFNICVLFTSSDL